MYRGKYGLYSIILSMGMCLISGCGISEHNYYPIESMPSDGATCTIYNFNIENYMNRGTSIQYFPQMPQRILACLLYTSPSPRDGLLSRMPSSA